MNRRNIKGITLLEAFLAAFLFVTSVAAIFVTMNALRKPAVNNERALQGAMILRNFLEDMRSRVDYRDYDSTDHNYFQCPLTDRTNFHAGTYNLSNVIYDIYYDVALDATGAKKVTARINWPDALN